MDQGLKVSNFTVNNHLDPMSITHFTINVSQKITSKIHTIYFIFEHAFHANRGFVFFLIDGGDNTPP